MESKLIISKGIKTRFKPLKSLSVKSNKEHGLTNFAYRHPFALRTEQHILSKSSYMMGQQCPKRLWLYKNRQDLLSDNSHSKRLIFEKGIDVGLLARDLFPGGHDSSPIDHFHYKDAVANTQQLIKNGTEVIYEAAFQHDGVLAVLDILVKKNNKWSAYEVKSSSEVKEYHYEDAALQFYVASGEEHAQIMKNIWDNPSKREIIKN